MGVFYRGNLTTPLLVVCLILLGIVRGYGQSGSYGNTFITAGAEMGVFGTQHSFQNGGGGMPGIIRTERTAPQGYLGFSAGSVPVSAADNAHVDGYVRTYNTAAFTFPIGDGTVYRPISIPVPTSSTSYDAAYFSSSPSTATLPAGAPFPTSSLATGVLGVSSLEYWDFNGTVATKVTLSWNAASNLNTLAGGDVSNLLVVGYNASTNKWESLGQGAVTGTLSGTGTITSAVSFVPNTYSAITFGGLAVVDLVMSMGQPSPALMAGVTSSLPVSVSNIGSGPTTGPIVVSLNVPANLTVPPTFTSGNFGCVVTSGTVSCTSTTPITSGSNDTFTVSVTPTQAAAGTSPTFTGLVTTPNDNNTGNNNAAPLTASPAVGGGAPDLITSIGQPSPALVAGATSSLPISVSNVGVGPTAGLVTVTMPLPGGINAPATFTAGNFGCVVTSGTVSCTSSTPISNGTGITLSIPVTPTPAATGTSPTFTAGASTPNDSNTGNNTATPTTASPAVGAGAPDLVTSIGQPSPALVAGVTSTLPVSVSNIGAGPTTGTITVTLPLPTGINAPATFTAGNFGCVVSNGTVTCTSNTPINYGSGTTLAIPITPSATATGTSPIFTGGSNTPGDSNTGNNGATPTITSPAVGAGTPDLVTSIGQPSPALVAGITSTLPVSVSNVGSGPTTGPITVTLTMPASVTAPATFTTGDFGCVVSNGVVTCTSNTPINYSSSTTLAIPITPLATATGTSPTFTGGADTPNDSNTGNNTATPTTASPAVGVGAPDLVTSLGQPSPALVASATSSLPVSVSNIGSGPTTGPITVTLPLPTGINAPATFTSGNFGCVVSNGTVTCTSNTPITSGSSTTLAVPVTPTAAAAGTSPTFTGGATTPNDNNTSNNNATPLTASPAVGGGAPDLITSIGQPSPALIAGATSSLPVSVSNVGVGPTTGIITVTLPLPTGINAPATFTTSNFGCVVTSGTVSCTSNAPINNGSGTTLFIPVTPTSAAIGTSPTFTGGADTPNDSNTGNNGATPTTANPAVGVGAPDLVTSIGQPSPALVAGVTSSLPVSVSNIGSGPTTGPITVTLTIPASVTAPATFTTSNFVCIVTNGLISCVSNTPLNNGSSITLAIPVTPLATATGTSPTFTGGADTPNDSNPTNNGATPTTTNPAVGAGVPDLTTSVGQPSPALVAGITSSLPVTVSNVGSGPTTGPITVTLPLPTGIDAPATFTAGNFGCVVSNGVVTCTSNTPIPVGGSTTVAIPVIPSPATTGTSPVFIAGTDTPNDNNTANNGATPITASPAVGVGAPDLVTSIGQPSPALVAGITSTLPVSVSNIGAGPTTGTITVTLPLPTGINAPATFTAGNFGCVVSNGTVTCTSNTPINYGSSATLAIPVTPTPATTGTSPTFTSGVSTPGDSNTGNNTATPTTVSPAVGVGSPDLTTIIGQPSPDLVAGIASSLPVTVSNVGSGPTTGPITVLLPLPAGVTTPATFTSGNFGCAVTGGVVSCTSTTPIPVGGSVTLGFPVTPTAAATGTTPTFTSGVSTPNDNNTSNNDAAPLTVTAPVGVGTPDLIMSIGQPSPVLAVDATSSLPVSVSNIGSGPTTGLTTISLPLPSGITTLATFSTGIFGCVVTGGVISCTSNVAISSGSSTTLAVPVIPTAASLGTTPTFTGGVTTPNDSNPANNSATPTTAQPPVSAAPDVVVSISQPSPALVAGSTNNIPVIVSNIGTASTTGPITVTLTIPAGVTIPASFNTGNFGCVVTGSVVSCTSSTLLLPGSNSTPVPAGSRTILSIPVTPTVALIGTSPTFTGGVSSANDGNPANNSANPMTVATPVTAAPVPDLVTRIGQPSPALVASATSSLPVSVSNIGSASTSGPITVTLAVPTSVTAPATFTTGNFGCIVTNGVVSCTSTAPITAGSSTTLAIPVTPTVAAIGTSPTFTGGVISPNDSNTANNGATPTTASPAVAPGAPDLISRIGQPSPSLMAGATSSLPVSVSNIGAGPTTAPITVTVAIPATMTTPATFISGNFGCVVTNGVVSCNSASPLAIGGSATLTIPVTPTVAAIGTSPTFTGGANTTNDSNTANNGATPTTASPAVAPGVPDLISRIGQPLPDLVAGMTSSLPVSVSNIGAGPTNGLITVTVAIPTSMTVPSTFTTGSFGCVVTNGVASCTSTTPVAVGGSTTLNIPVTPTVAAIGTSPTFTGGVISPNDSNTANNGATPMTITNSVAPGAPDLITRIGQPSPALIVGATSSLPVSVSNIGAGPTTGAITVTVTLPAGMITSASFTTGSFGCVVTNGVVSCSSTAPLAIGGSITLAIPVTPTAAAVGTSPTFTGGVSTTSDSNTANNGATPTTVTTPVTAAPAPDLITRIGQPNPALVNGVTSSLPVSVSNIGSASTTAIITVTLPLPLGITAPATFTTGSFGCVVTAGVVSCTSTTPVAVGSSTTLAIPVTPTALAVGTTPTFIGGVSTANDSNTANNGATPTTVTTPVKAAMLTLKVMVLLQGALINSAASPLMRDDLRAGGYIPLKTPYSASVSSRFAQAGGGGGETTTSTVLSANAGTANAIVDWVLIELRSASNPSTVVATQSALVQRDGDVVSATDGVSPLAFSSVTGTNYYVSVKHRNHLGAMTATAIPFSVSGTVVDFTTLSATATYNIPSSAVNYDGVEMATINGKRALWAGNANHDNKVKYIGMLDDNTAIFNDVINAQAGNATPTYNYDLAFGYFYGDIDMNGKVKYQGVNTDPTVIFNNVLAIYPLNAQNGQLYNYDLFIEQLP